MSASETSVAESPKRRGPLRWLYDWVMHWADTPYGTQALALISVAESSVFPIPPDVLQIALSISRPARSFYYAAVASAGSVVGGVLGWLIGYGVWAGVSGFFFDYVPGFTHESFDYVSDLYQNNAFLAIFSAAFTPIPYKVFTIAAGVCDVPLPVLIAASALGRSARFFLVGACIYFFGAQVKSLLDRYLGLATIILAALFVGGFVVIRHLVK